MNVETVIISNMIGNLVDGSPTMSGGQGISMSIMKWFLERDKGGGF